GHGGHGALCGPTGTRTGSGRLRRARWGLLVLRVSDPRHVRHREVDGLNEGDLVPCEAPGSPDGDGAHPQDVRVSLNLSLGWQCLDLGHDPQHVGPLQRVPEIPGLLLHHQDIHERQPVERPKVICAVMQFELHQIDLQGFEWCYFNDSAASIMAASTALVTTPRPAKIGCAKYG